MNNLNTILNELNSKLPAGIAAKPAVFGNKMILQYHVRYTQEGKKYSVGVFLTVGAAITAMINHKINKLLVVNASHRERLEQLYLEMANSQSTENAMGLEDIAIQTLKQVSNKDSSITVKTKMMEAFMNSRPPHDISSDKDYDFLWAADFGGDGRMYTIKGKMIDEYYRELENSMRLINRVDTAGNDTPEIGYGTGKKVPTQDTQSIQDTQDTQTTQEDTQAEGEDKFNENDW